MPTPPRGVLSGFYGTVLFRERFKDGAKAMRADPELCISENGDLQFESTDERTMNWQKTSIIATNEFVETQGAG